MVFPFITVTSRKHLRFVRPVVDGVDKRRGTADGRPFILHIPQGTQRIRVGDPPDQEVLELKEYPSGVRVTRIYTGDIYEIARGGFENIHGVGIRHTQEKR